MSTPIPPIGEQQRIIEFLSEELEKINSSIETAKDISIKLEEYRTALISDAVTGKIDVRGFNER